MPLCMCADCISRTWSVNLITNNQPTIKKVTSCLVTFFYMVITDCSRMILSFVGQIVGVDAAEADQGQGENSRYGATGVEELLVGGIQADVTEVHVFHRGSAAGFGAIVELNTKYYVIDC